MKRRKLLALVSVAALLTGLGWFLLAGRSQMPAPADGREAPIAREPQQVAKPRPASPHVMAGKETGKAGNQLTVAPDAVNERDASEAVVAEDDDLPEVQDAPQCPRYPDAPVHAYRAVKLAPKFKGGAEGELREWLVKPNPEGYEHHVEEEYFPDDTGEMVLASHREYVANQVMLTLDGETTDEEFAGRIARFGGRIKNVLMPLDKGRRIVAVEVPEISLDAASRLRENVSATVGTLSVSHDDITTINSAPNDAKFSQLWGMNSIKAPSAWNIVHDAPSVVVGVLDTGINYDHQDLAGNMWRNPSTGSVAGFSNDRYGARCINGVKSGDPKDDQGHGSHCAGIIGAVGNNGVGVAGVAWKVQLMALKAFYPVNNGQSASAASSDCITLMQYALEKGVDILNCSFGSARYNLQEYSAISQLRSENVMVVCAAGNDASNNDSVGAYPACYALDNIVSVAATTSTDALASFSNYGTSSVDIAAPGENILSAYYSASSAYATASGTSQATPHVAGALALLKAKFPTETYGQLYQRLYIGADAVSALSGKVQGGRRLNVLRAVSTTLIPPLVSASDGTFVNCVRVTWASVSGATHYRVYRSTTETGTKTALGSGWQTGTTFNDTSARANTVYYYWVRAATSSSGANATGYGVPNTGFAAASPSYPDAWDPNDDTPTATTNVLSFSTSARTQTGHGLSASDLYDFYKASLTAGQTYVIESTGEYDMYGELFNAANTNTSSRVTYNDDISSSNRNFRITYTPTSSGTYYLRVRRYLVGATATYGLRYQRLIQPDAWDPTDNTASSATSLTPTTTVQTHGPHTLSSADSYDWFKVQMTSGRTYVFEGASDIGSDTYGELYNSTVATSSTRVEYDDDGGEGLQFKITYTPTTSGWYYLRVRKYSTGTDGMYSLKYSVSVPNTHDIAFCKSSSWGDCLFLSNVTNAMNGMNAFTTNDTIYVTYGFGDICNNDISTPFTNKVQLVRYESAQSTSYSVVATDYAHFPHMEAGTWWESRAFRINRPSVGYWGFRIELNMPRSIAETNTANNVRIVRYRVTAPASAKTLSRVEIASGPSSVEAQDGTTAHYTAKAYFSDNTEADVTAVSTWSVSPAASASFSSPGELSPRQVSERTAATISVAYVYNGVSKTGTKTVSIYPTSDAGGACPFPGTVEYPPAPMTVYAQVMIDGEPALAGDVLAAFSADGEVRGRVELGEGGRRPLNIYVTTPNEPISFRVWSHLDGTVYPCMTTLAGEMGGARGDPSEPYVIDCGNDPFGVFVQYPNPPMTIVARVVIKGVPAARGDRVGVFCGNELRAKGAVRVENGVAKITLAPSVSVAGETLTFKVWDASEQELLNAVGTLRAAIGGEVGTPSSRYLIEVSDTVTQSIAFNGSTWQFVSLNVAPVDASPRAVFQGIIRDIDRITCGDKVFKPSWGDADNTLGAIVAGAGYWVKRATSGSVSASVTGLPADVQTTRISLVSGWNSVGYVPQMAGPIRTVLANALASGKINRVVAGDQVFYPSWSDSDNTLTAMQPGVGYWIKATGPVTFTFTEPSGTASAAALAAICSGESHPFGELRDRDPVSGCMLKARLSLFGASAAYGDATVAAYAVVGGVPNDLPCGVAAVNLEGNVVMNVQKYLPFSLVFKVWDAQSGRVYDADTIISFSTGEDEKLDETIVVNGEPPSYRVVFELSGTGVGSGVRTGGGALTQLVARASAAIAPTVVGAPGYEFLLWDADFSCVKSDMVVHAVYKIDDSDPVAPPTEFSFASCAVTAEKGGAFALVVSGGDAAAPTSVKVNVAYGSAKAADLNLKQATVVGADGVVERTNLKFPLTLNWERGDVGPKTISIPVAVGKRTDAPKVLVWNLSDAAGLPLAERASCIGTIAAGEDWDQKGVSVMPYVANTKGGKASGAASVRPDAKGAYKAATLKATANKGYWFAGWYDGNGSWVCGDASFKVTPDGSTPVSAYEARFVPGQKTFCGTYNGHAVVNLKGMTLVKNADTSSDVYGHYAFTATLSAAGKVSGSVTVGGKKITLKGDSVFVADDSRVSCRVTADEKVCFGRVNTEILTLAFDDEGAAWLTREGDEGDGIGFEPLGGEDSIGLAYKDVSKDKTETVKFTNFAGTYTGASVLADDGVVPVSIVIDKTGKVKLTGRFADGSSLSASGALCRYEADGEGLESAHLDLVMAPKTLGCGAYHLSLDAVVEEGEAPCLWFTDCVTTYTASEVSVEEWDELGDAFAPRFTPGCWIPPNADPDYGVVHLGWAEDAVDILFASKNGVITGLGSALTSGVTVRFDARSGLLTVTRGKEYVIQGVLVDANETSVAGIIHADGTRGVVGVSINTLAPPEEIFPWTQDDFVLCVGQHFGELFQASVVSGNSSFELTITGLPSGLKYDKKTGLITGAPTKAGTYTVKVSYKFGPRTITRVTSLVVSAKPDDLPVGSYTGCATVFIDGESRQMVNYPFTATIDKNGALAGSITLFGKKAAFKAAGYDSCLDGVVEYGSAVLDLKSINRSWATASLFLTVEGDGVEAFCPAFGPGHSILISAHRDRSKDADFAQLVDPYVGRYVMALEIEDDAGAGVMPLSVTVDRKGVVKVAGTFVDGTSVSASSVLYEGIDQSMCAFVSISPKAWAQGAMSLEFSFEPDEEGMPAAVYCIGSAAKYILANGDYRGIAVDGEFGYAYSPLSWVDASLPSEGTCLSVVCDNDAFEEVWFAWKTKGGPASPEIVGVGRRLSGPNMTFRLDDKTGLFSGTCGKYKIFGAMMEGTCFGEGTVIGPDGSVGKVYVDSCWY